MERSTSCGYSDAYMLVKGTIIVTNTAAQGQQSNGTKKKVIFKNCATFTNYIRRINNTQVDDAQDIDVVMPMYNLIQYSNNYLRDEAYINVADSKITDFNADSTITDSFKTKERITGKTNGDGSKEVKIMVPLKF